MFEENILKKYTKKIIKKYFFYRLKVCFAIMKTNFSASEARKYAVLRALKHISQLIVCINVPDYLHMFI